MLGFCFLEEVGFWNPLIKQKVLKKDRIKYWLSVGAQPSETIHNLLVSEKIIEGKIKEKQTVTFTAADEELVIQELESTDMSLESGHDEASDAESESTAEDSD